MRFPEESVAFAVASFVIWFAYAKSFQERKPVRARATAWRRFRIGRRCHTVTSGPFLTPLPLTRLSLRVAGLAVAVAAAPRWQTALLLSGTCLLIGAFFGLLFGYPQGVAQSATTRSSPAPCCPLRARQRKRARQSRTARQQRMPRRQATVRRQGRQPPRETGALQRRISQERRPPETGRPAGHATKEPHRRVSFHPREGPCRLHACKSGATHPSLSLPLQYRRACSWSAEFTRCGFVLAGAIILYFFATGFFSGLLLPSYFMSGKFG